MSRAVSDIVSGVAPTLVGVWVHDPLDASDTVRSYPFADGRTEHLAPESSVLTVVGRTRPVVEFGEALDESLKVTIFVPFGPEHDEAVQWWRDAVLARRAIFYRDNRGRAFYGVLASGVDPVDGRAGTALAVELTRVDWEA